MFSHRLTPALLILCLSWNFALAKEKPEVIAVSVTIGPGEIVAGDLGEAEVIVENVTDAAVTVTLDGVIEYADGTTDRLINVTRRTALTIQPEQGFIINLLFFVPPETASGEATFTATAKVVDVAGQGNGTVEKRASESASFEVVEP
jgi:hypothetical protein